MHICRREKAQGLHLRRGGPWGPQVTLIYASARRPCRRERGVSSFPKKALFKEGPLSLSTRDLLTACGAHGPEPGQTASSHSEFSGRHHHVAGSSLSWFSNLMIHLVTLLREAQSRLARSGEPRSCGSTWPGGPGRRHPYPGRCPHRAAQGSAWSQVPRLPERGSWELRMLRLRAQGVLSQQAFSRSPHPNSPFLATKGAWLQRPPHSPIRRPRSRGGCEPFSPPFRGCFGHPDPGVSGGARTPPDKRAGLQPRLTPVAAFPFRISICHQTKPRAELREERNGWRRRKSAPSCSPKRKSSGTLAKFYLWYFNLFSYRGPSLQRQRLRASVTPGQPGCRGGPGAAGSNLALEPGPRPCPGVRSPYSGNAIVGDTGLGWYERMALLGLF